jgi:hypothetical protein
LWNRTWAIFRNVAGCVLRYVEARGDVPQNALELDDVVDLALARTSDKFAREHAPENIRRRLIRFAVDEIEMSGACSIVRKTTYRRSSLLPAVP